MTATSVHEQRRSGATVMPYDEFDVYKTAIDDANELTAAPRRRR